MRKRIKNTEAFNKASKEAIIDYFIAANDVSWKADYINSIEVFKKRIMWLAKKT